MQKLDGIKRLVCLLINFIIKAFEAFVKEKILAGVKFDDFFAAFSLIRA